MVRRPATALAAAFACLGGLVVTWGLTFGSGRVRWLDAAALQGFVRTRPAGHPGPGRGRGGPRRPAALRPARRRAWSRSRSRAGARGSRWRCRSCSPAPAVTTELLKPLLADPRVHALARRRPRSPLPRGPAGTRPRRWRSRCARCSSAPPRWRPTVGGRSAAAFAVAVAYAHPHARLALPERRHRRLPASPRLWTTAAVAALWRGWRRAGPRGPAARPPRAGARAGRGRRRLAAARCSGSLRSRLARPDGAVALRRRRTRRSSGRRGGHRRARGGRCTAAGVRGGAAALASPAARRRAPRAAPRRRRWRRARG